MKMKLYLLVLVVFVCVLACQKELDKIPGPPIPPPVTDTTGTGNGGDSTNSIIGTWQFVSMEAKTRSSTEATIGVDTQRVEAFLDYLSTDNGGTISISDSLMNCTALTYKIASNIRSFRYHNGVLIDSLITPYTITFPETDSYTPYKMVTADSIFFRKGGFTNISASRFRVTSTAAKMDLKEDVLILTQPIIKDTIENISGVEQHTIIDGVAIFTLTRKKQ